MRIRTEADVTAALDELCATDPRLASARAACAEVPLRLRAPGLAGLLRIVAGQQLSTRAAEAVWQRFAARFTPLEAAAVAAADDETLAALGLSRQKIRTFRAVAAAVEDGLDLEALAEGPAEDARAALEAIKGIGRWSADIYLMFCAGHPDIFPVGDLAVRKAMCRALALPQEPRPDELLAMAECWAPHRSSAARLMWAYYRASPGTGEGLPL